MATFPRHIPISHRTLQAAADRPKTATQPPTPRWSSKLPGDPLALRGIPAIGMNVQGAITGTQP